MQKNHLFAGLILLFIFLLGAVTGGVGVHLFYVQTQVHPFPPGPPPLELSGRSPMPPGPPLPGPGRQDRILERLDNALALSDTQYAAISHELGGITEKFRTLHENTRSEAINLAGEMRERVERHLSEEQKVRFEELYERQVRWLQERRDGNGRPAWGPPRHNQPMPRMQRRLERWQQEGGSGNAPPPPDAPQPNTGPSEG